MKCVSIVYRRPRQQNLVSQFIPIRSVKRNVDQYYEKLKQKEHQQKYTIKAQPCIPRSMLNTAQTYRTARSTRQKQMIESINIIPIRASSQNILRNQLNPQNTIENKQKKWRSNFIKRKTATGFYSLKGINMKNNHLFDDETQKNYHKNNEEQMKIHSKLVNLKKLKLTKNNTILISIDFVLNENNFWEQESIDQQTHKNWKTLQDHSNIVWLTKRENSAKKLQKYATQHGLRLDGIYQILPRKKTNTLTLSLSSFQKDFKYQIQLSNSTKKPFPQQIKKQIIILQSLNVTQIKNIKYDQFYNSFPVCKSLRCIVHFIQIDINDKSRFNLPLKILSKDKLPSPNSINHLFKEFYKNNKNHQTTNPHNTCTTTLQIHNNFSQFQAQEQDPYQFSKQQMMIKYDQIKQDFIDYFNHNLKVNMNKKLQIGQSEFSLQFLIGDMLKRNFNIMYNYKKQSNKIKNKLEDLKNKKEKKGKTEQNIQTIHRNNLFRNNPSNTLCVDNNISVHKTKQNLFNIKLINQQAGGMKHKYGIEQLIKSKLIGQDEVSLDRKSFAKSQKFFQEQNKIYYKQPVFLWKK